MGTCPAAASGVDIRPIAVAVVAVATAVMEIAADKVVVAMVATVVSMCLQGVAAMVVMALAIADWIAVADMMVAVGTHFLAVVDKAAAAAAIVDTVDLARIGLVVAAGGIVTRGPSFLVENQ